MKVRALLWLLLVGVFPASLSANTLYFPQVAFGGGYSTTFVIVNTGTTSVSAPLTFRSQGGAARADLNSPTINIAAGSSARFTLPNTGALTVVWGEFAAGSGTVQGVATFDLRDAGGKLISSAGVLGLDGRNSFLLPVDVTSSGATGLAIANATDSPITANLRLIGEDGNQVGTSSRQLPARGQMADFVTNLQLPVGGTFKGTLIIDAPSGAPANALAATALTVKEGLLSALPVIAGGTPGTTVLDFPQVAFGGGYSTTFTLMNTGSTPMAGLLNFYSQGGAARGDLSSVINIPAGGSARYSIPNQGPLTVVWGELVATTGSVQGVATFDLRAADGTLTSTAGVLGLQSGNGFTLPVDVTPSGATGIALANTANSGLTLVLRLYAEDGTLVATATDARFTTLASRGQMADFVTNVFPQLSGTTFKGTLSVTLGAGMPAGSIAATALTVKEGLLAALPVIAGGGGGGGTSTAAADCLNAPLYAGGSTLHYEYAVSGAQTGNSIVDVVSTPNVTFENQTTTEIKFTQANAFTGTSPTTTTVKTYSKLDGLDILTYGAAFDVAPPTTPVPGTGKSVYNPPARDKRYSLVNAGDTTSWSYDIKTTITLNGVSTPIIQNSSQTMTVKYLGRESVTVPAGTFNTCKFEINNGASTNWNTVGIGATVKTASTDPSGTTTYILKTGTVNGSSIQ